MSQQTTTQRKGKKSYAQILSELDDIFSKTASVAIPQLCEAAKEENPEWDNKEIQNQVEADVKKYWAHETVYKFLPSWIHSEKQVIAAKKRWEKRHADEQEILVKNIKKLAENPIEKPELPDEGSTPYEEMQDEDLGLSELNDIGDTAESALGVYEKINVPARNLFKALTQKEMPTLTDDLVLDFLKPSREYKSAVFHEIDNNMLVSLYNVLAWTRDAIDDTLNMLDKLTKTKEAKKV